MNKLFCKILTKYLDFICYFLLFKKDFLFIDCFYNLFKSIIFSLNKAIYTEMGMIFDEKSFLMVNVSFL